ncbi:MAG: zinc ribbon domain-containing protein, partial [Treponema sp.]|nr:zinc ribbon domain-containing protein [Treponema sp.]
NCGEKISKDLPPKFCVWCGTELDDDSVFCFNCGKNIKSEYETKITSYGQSNEWKDDKKDFVLLNRENISSGRESKKKEFTWGHFIIVMAGMIAFMIMLPLFIEWLMY